MIAIITDSTCDIPDALLKQYDIAVVPINVVWGNRQYRDRVDLTSEEFYSRLSLKDEYPSSATPSVTDFQEAYRQAIGQGAEALVVLTVSSAMSGVYQIATSAAQQDQMPIAVIDSKGPTMSLGWQVLAAARARDAGAGLDAIVECVAQVRANLMQLVYMESIEYLRRGGRIGQAVKWLGVALHVRPIVSINHETGFVEPMGLARTRKSGIDMMYSKFAAFMEGKRDRHVAVLHGNCPEEAQALAE